MLTISHTAFRSLIITNNFPRLKDMTQHLSPAEWSEMLGHDNFIAVSTAVRYAHPQIFNHLWGNLTDSQKQTLRSKTVSADLFATAMDGNNISMVQALWKLATEEHWEIIATPLWMLLFILPKMLDQPPLYLMKLLSPTQHTELLATRNIFTSISSVLPADLNHVIKDLTALMPEVRNPTYACSYLDLIFSTCTLPTMDYFLKILPQEQSTRFLEAVFQVGCLEENIEQISQVWQRATQEQRNLFLTGDNCRLYHTAILYKKTASIQFLRSMATPEQRIIMELCVLNAVLHSKLSDCRTSPETHATPNIKPDPAGDVIFQKLVTLGNAQYQAAKNADRTAEMAAEMAIVPYVASKLRC